MTKFGIGQAVRRVEDGRFTTGTGQYVGDVALARQCYGVAVLSPHAHAGIKRVDTTAAKASPGVVCVLTGADAAGDNVGGIPPFFMPESWGGPKGFSTTRPILLADRVRCIGDRVAFVVAETEVLARDAAELNVVDYEPLPAIVDVEAAIAPNAPTIWKDCPNGNVGVTIAFGDKPATDAAFAGAKHVAAVRLVNNRVTANPIEPRCAVGVYDAADGRYTLYTTSQDPHSVRTALSSFVFHVPESKIRVLSPDVGGGFGMKANLYPDDALVLWAARRCGRPVKWTATRSESLLCDNHARDQVVYGELALDENGKFLAIRSTAYQALGAYWWGAATAPLFWSVMFVPSLYDVQTIHVSTNAVFTNTAPTSVYRGAGRPEAIYLIERLVECAAQVTGIDRVELRRRNMIKPEALPYHTPTHHNYDSGEFEKLMDHCLALADWNGFAARRKESERCGKLRGRAVTPYIELGGVMNERMEIRFDPGGTVTIVAGTHSHGQGHATTFAQLVAEWLGVPFEAINYVQGDTEKVAFGRGTFGARSSLVGGNGLRMAADAVVARGKQMAGALMEAAAEDVEFNAGTFTVIGTDRRISITDVARAFFAPAGPVMKFGLGLDGVGTWSGAPGGAPNYPNGCHVCEVEVDPETGGVRMDRFAAVDDLGMVINPMICEGQIHGGIAQGVGQALFENMVYDGQSGQLITGSFLDYGMPRAADFPEFVSELLEVPAKTNPLGIKGIGEAGTIAAPPTVVNAVIDALKEFGVTHLDMPLTSERVWAAMNSREENAWCRKGNCKNMSSQVTNATSARSAPVIREHRIPTRNSKPYIAVEGPDRNLWFCESGASKIGCFDPRAVEFREFDLPSPDCTPIGIDVGPDGHLWFTEKTGNRVGRIGLDGTTVEFGLPTPKAGPDGIIRGPDGNMWFSAGDIDRLCRVTPNGTITEFGEGITPGSRPLSIVIRGEILWFSEAAGGRIGRMTLDGRVVEFPIPSRDSQPRAMTCHSDSNIWFVETGANCLGRIAPDGTIVEFPVPTGNASLRGIAVGADGDLWFTENFANKIGRMAPDGTVVGEYDIPTPESGARCITAMSDGRLFFTQYDAGLIGEIIVGRSNTDNAASMAVSSLLR